MQPETIAAAAAIKDRYRTATDRIRGDVNLSTNGQRRQLAVAYTNASDELSALNNSNANTDATREATLERRLFGATTNDPATHALYRDAIDRAEQIDTDTDAVRLLARSHRLGDTDLARAIALVASERGWIHVWADYRDTLTTPDRAAFDELAELRRNSHHDRFIHGQAFALPKPPELSVMNSGRIRALATDTDPNVATSGPSSATTDDTSNVMRQMFTNAKQTG